MENNHKFIALIRESCPHCQEAKRILKDRIDSGKIRLLSVDSDEGASLADKLKVIYITTIIVDNEVTHTSKVCQLSKDGTKAICQDEEVDL